jgi:uncharacterized protein
VSFVVEQIWRYPIKSIGGEKLQLSYADENGLRGDRVWAVHDDAGKLGSGKDSRRFTRILGLLNLSASYVDDVPVLVGPEGSYPVPDAADAYLQAMTGRSLHVRRDTGVMYFDEVPFSLVGTATLDWLASRVSVAVDARRLRPNIVVRTEEPFAEEAWIGRTVRIGEVEAIFDRVFMRCVMVNMAQPGLPAGKVLKKIGQRGDPCMAIGGHICTPGVIRVGDNVLY